MGASSDVSGKTKATATQYNNLRKDVVDTTSGHDHDGTDSKQVDHGGLGGRADDDHSQYWNDARGAVGVKAVKLDDLTAPDDNTDLNASTSKHGLLLKLDNNASHYLGGQGSWTTPPGGVVTTVLKTADETVNNSETLQNDDHLVLAVGADDVWVGLIDLRFISASVTPDLDFAFALPSGGAMFGIQDFTVDTEETFTPDLTDQTTLDVASSEKHSAFFFVYIGGGTAGNAQLQWAQHTATEEDTKLTTNSFIIAWKLS